MICKHLILNMLRSLLFKAIIEQSKLTLGYAITDIKL